MSYHPLLTTVIATHSCPYKLISPQPAAYLADDVRVDVHAEDLRRVDHGQAVHVATVLGQTFLRGGVVRAGGGVRVVWGRLLGQTSLRGGVIRAGEGVRVVWG